MMPPLRRYSSNTGLQLGMARSRRPYARPKHTPLFTGSLPYRLNNPTHASLAGLPVHELSEEEPVEARNRAKHAIHR